MHLVVFAIEELKGLSLVFEKNAHLKRADFETSVAEAHSCLFMPSSTLRKTCARDKGQNPFSKYMHKNSFFDHFLP